MHPPVRISVDRNGDTIKVNVKIEVIVQRYLDLSACLAGENRIFLMIRIVVLSVSPDAVANAFEQQNLVQIAQQKKVIRTYLQFVGKGTFDAC